MPFLVIFGDRKERTIYSSDWLVVIDISGVFELEENSRVQNRTASQPIDRSFCMLSVLEAAGVYVYFCDCLDSRPSRDAVLINRIRNFPTGRHRHRRRLFPSRFGAC